jgi:hypothetical protein
MPALYAAGSNVALLYAAVFVVYWCYDTQLSVNSVAASDFWGTKNTGINYGIQVGAVLLRNPPQGYQPNGWSPARRKRHSRKRRGRNSDALRERH